MSGRRPHRPVPHPAPDQAHYPARPATHRRQAHLASPALLAAALALPPLCSTAAGSGPHAAPACLGDRAPLVVDQQMPYARVTVAGQPGYFVLDFGATVSNLTPAGFAVPPQPLPGSADRYGSFDFFGPWGTVTLPTQTTTPVTRRVRQAGVIGTDFLAKNIYTLDYARGRLYRARPGAFCTDAQLTAAGFRPLSTQGHYAPDPQALTCPQAGGPPHCVNVPTVPLRIGPVQAVAQLDTGYDDGQRPLSVNINAALLQALRDAGVALTPRPDIALQLSTCVPGVSETIEAWQPAPGTPFGLLDTAGALLPHPAGRLTLFVKRTPPQAAVCGGIGTWVRPAAQLGASFVAKGAVVVDPGAGRVWVR